MLQEKWNESVRGMNPQFLEALLAQHAGIQLEYTGAGKVARRVDYRKQKLEKLDREGKVSLDPDDAKRDSLEMLKLWLLPGDPFLDEVNIDSTGINHEVELSRKQLLQLNKLIGENIQKRVGSGVELAREWLGESKIELQAKRTYTLLQWMENSTYVREGKFGRTQLEMARKFVGEEFGLKSGIGYRDEKTQTWIDKMSYVQQGTEKGKYDEGRKARAQRKLLGLMENDVKADRDASLIWEETLRLATVRNLGLLVEKMEKNNPPIDLRQMRENIGKLDLESKEGMLSLISELNGVTNFFVKEFPHDHAFMLGHTLSKMQATCAGKTLMFNLTLQTLGLEPKPTDVKVGYEGNTDYHHSVVHLSRGQHTVEWDLNSPISNESGCAVSLMQESIVGLISKDQLEIERLSLIKNKQYMRLDTKHYRQLVRIWGDTPHKLTSEGAVQLIHYRNLAKDFADIQDESITNRDRRSCGEAIVRYLYKAIDANPLDSNAYIDLAEQLSNEDYLELLGSDIERKYSRQKALSYYDKSIALFHDKDYFQKRARFLCGSNFLESLTIEERKIMREKALRDLQYFEAGNTWAELKKVELNTQIKWWWIN